jgi:hypothetical protein
MGVAKELGYSLSQLAENMTLEELMMWSAFFAIQHDEHEAAMKKARRR